MNVKLRDLIAELTPAGRREVTRRSREHLKAMEDAARLDQVRKAAKKKQSEVAELMGIGQNAVSQLEARSDVQLSTLNRYVESLGLRLELVVVAESGERAVLRNYRPWQSESPKKGTAEGSRRTASGLVVEKAPGKSARTRRESAVAAKSPKGLRGAKSKSSA
ncbi:helix-turn-helix domain-containing protein [Ramlibacter sp.]|uniref:helix-turn-helix domain-containing protein n=1 Tax=Ramlibacter sp. TaxID=1917967 RepID=UPI003D0D5436